MRNTMWAHKQKHTHVSYTQRQAHTHSLTHTCTHTLTHTNTQKHTRTKHTHLADNVGHADAGCY